MVVHDQDRRRWLHGSSLALRSTLGIRANPAAVLGASPEPLPETAPKRSPLPRPYSRAIGLRRTDGNADDRTAARKQDGRALLDLAVLASGAVLLPVWVIWASRVGGTGTIPARALTPASALKGARRATAAGISQLPRLPQQRRCRAVRATRRGGSAVHHGIDRRAAGERQDQLSAWPPFQRPPRIAHRARAVGRGPSYQPACRRLRPGQATVTKPRTRPITSACVLRHQGGPAHEPEQY